MDGGQYKDIGEYLMFSDLSTSLEMIRWSIIHDMDYTSSYHFYKYMYINSEGLCCEMGGSR